MSFLKRGWIAIAVSFAIIWVSLIPLPIMSEIKFIPLDKIGHFVAFFILGLLYLWAFDYPGSQKKQAFNKNLNTFIITTFIGGAIELLQHYLPVNRHGDWHDFFFDIAGIIFAIIIYPMIKRSVLKKFGLLFLAFTIMQVNGQDAFTNAKAFQEELNSEFINPETSILDSVDFLSFTKLDFFPIDTTFNVIAKLIKVSDTPFFGMPTTTDRKPEYRTWATAVFILNDNQYRLTIYQNKKLMDNPEYFDYLFLPFLDLTNGESTYGGGRYIDLRIPDGDTIVIDFNKAYNPYCAYNHHYSCPIVPSDNFLDVEVNAGVKKFK
jgi:VanZ family protein